jgi:transcriptional regulator with XRE-family HTH domain
MQQKKLPNGNFFSRLGQLLEKSPLNQKALAYQLEISEAALVRYKQDRIPKADELYRIAKHFGVSMEWLLHGDEFTNGSNGEATAWRDRALAAENKIQMLKAGIEAVLKKI